MKDDFHLLHDALLDLTGLFNQPAPDAALIAAAGIELDRALFPLLVRIERRGPVGVVELAGLVGRDYTTVSRQVAKLESLGLVRRRPGEADKRVREAVVSERGRAISHALDAARDALYERMLAHWDRRDLHRLATLLRRLADEGMAWAKESLSED